MKSANLSELKLIRTALDLSQAEMGRLLGVNAQSAYQFWETNPDKPASRVALEKAKAVYRERTGRPWDQEPITLRELVGRPQEAPTPAAGAYVTREEYGELVGRLKRLEEDFRALLPLAVAVKDLDERVRKLAGDPESRG